MSDSIDDGGPAFPSHPDSSYAGMTLRDWYIGQALANPAICDGTRIATNVSLAVQYAKEVLKARGQ
jgi:hypothetical protein